MKKYLTLLLTLLLLLNTSLALAEQADAVAMQRARETLEKLGFPVSDESFDMALEQHRMMQEWYAQAGYIPAEPNDQSELAYQLLLCEGIGVYDYDTLTWTATSDRIYVFDAEFFNIEGMYTEFLQGVQSIMPDAQITAVREDLSGLDEYLEGKRKVFFEFDGHSYVVTLNSDGDWLNAEIIDFLNQVLKTEGYTKQLHCVSDAWDQMVFLIYGAREDAAALRTLLGVEAQEEADADGGLLDWLAALLGR